MPVIRSVTCAHSVYKAPLSRHLPRAHNQPSFGAHSPESLNPQLLSIQKLLLTASRVQPKIKQLEPVNISPDGFLTAPFVEAMKQLRQLPIEALYYSHHVFNGESVQDKAAQAIRSLIDGLYERVQHQWPSKRYFNDLRFCLRQVPAVVLNAHADALERTTVLDHLALLSTSKVGQSIPLLVRQKGQHYADLLLKDAVTRGGDLLHRSANGWTTFHRIAAYGNRLAIEHAVSTIQHQRGLQSVLSDRTNWPQKTPLELALKELNPYTLPVLLRECRSLKPAFRNWFIKQINEQGVLANSLRFDQGYPQRHAMSHYRVKVFDYLLGLPGLDVNSPDSLGFRPIHRAIAIMDSQHRRLRRLLKQPGLDVNALNQQGETALHQALSAGYIGAIPVLLTHPQINVHIKNTSGLTPWELARAMSWSEQTKPVLNALFKKTLVFQLNT